MRPLRSIVAALACFAGCAQRASPERPVVVAYPSGPATLAPDGANEEFALSILSNAYESLVSFDRAMNVVPGLAETWYTEGDLTWVFRLREKIPLHDGRNLEARDVVASLERSRTGPDSYRRGELNRVRSIEARDPRTVVVRTDSPIGVVPNRLATVPISLEPSRPGDPPVGTGPYRIRSWTPRGDTLLEAFEGYRRGRPSVRALHFRVVPSVEDRIEKLRGGEVHVVVDVPAESMSLLEATPGVRTISEKGLRVLFLGLDCAHPTSPNVLTKANPFRDPRVRRALALAIDREALVAGPLGGQAEVIDQLVPPPVFGYHRRLPRMRFDSQEARRLMAAAGYESGFEVALDFAPKKYRAMEAVVQHLAADLGKLRIRVVPRRSESAEFFQRLDRRDTSLYVLGWISTSGDASVSYDYLLHTSGAGHGTQNSGGYSDPEVDRLLDEASATSISAKRAELLAAAAERTLRDVPVVPLYRQMDLYAVARDLEFQPLAVRWIQGAQMRWKP